MSRRLWPPPNGTLATVLSWIPFYTPFVMMNRAAADPPLFDRVGTMVLLIAMHIAIIRVQGVTECYECQPKPPPKQFPVCTIRA